MILNIDKRIQVALIKVFGLSRFWCKEKCEYCYQTRLYKKKSAASDLDWRNTTSSLGEKWFEYPEISVPISASWHSRTIGITEQMFKIKYCWIVSFIFKSSPGKARRRTVFQEECKLLKFKFVVSIQSFVIFREVENLRTWNLLQFFFQKYEGASSIS